MAQPRACVTVRRSNVHGSDGQHNTFVCIPSPSSPRAADTDTAETYRIRPRRCRCRYSGRCWSARADLHWQPGRPRPGGVSDSDARFYLTSASDPGAGAGALWIPCARSSGSTVERRGTLISHVFCQMLDADTSVGQVADHLDAGAHTRARVSDCDRTTYDVWHSTCDIRRCAWADIRTVEASACTSRSSGLTSLAGKPCLPRAA